MTKSLINKLKKGVCLVAAAASIGFASCKMPDPIPNPINYAPTAELSACQENQDKEIIVNLDGQDQNGKQDIISYEVSVKDSNGQIIYDKSQESPFNNALISTNNTGTFSVLGQCRDSKGAVGNAGPIQVIVNPPVVNPIVISGNFGDDENKGIKAGMIKVYNDNHKLLETILTDSNTGNFIIDIDPSISTNNIILQAISGTDVNPTSYIRTITVPKVNSSSNIIKVVPYESGWSQTDANNFIIHMGRVNFWSDAERQAEGITGGVTGNPFSGLKKWNRGEISDDINHPMFKGIEVSSNDFSGTEYNQIKSLIQRSSCPNSSQINITYGESHTGENGWGKIILGTGSPYTISVDQNGLDGYIERFTTYLTHAQILDYIVRHEVLGHGMFFPGHADGSSTNSLFDSIMKYANLNPPNDFTPIDIKGSYIVNTYSGMEFEDDILGTSF